MDLAVVQIQLSTMGIRYYYLSMQVQPLVVVVFQLEPISGEELFLKMEQQELSQRRSKLMRAISAEATEATAGLDRKSKEYRTKRSAVYAKHQEKTAAFAKESRALQKQLNALVPAAQRRSFVWLYERL